MANGSNSSLQDTAKETARAKLGEQQHAAAGGLGEFAGALRKTAREMDGGDSQLLGRFAHTAADGLERAAETLRRKDLDGMVRDAERFAREQPALFFGATIAAGFLAVRFLKARPEPQNPGHPANPANPANPNPANPGI